MRIVRRVVVLLLALAGMQGVPTRHALATSDPVGLTFNKVAIAAGVWEGTVSGDIEGTLRTALLTVDETGPIWEDTSAWIIGSGERSFTAPLDGVLNTRTGTVSMDGSVTDSYLLGACVHEAGQAVGAATSPFTGYIAVFPATQG